MATRKTPAKDAAPLEPYINIMSAANSDFDYFPLMSKDRFEGIGQTIVTSMKNGTYTPFMGAVEYKAEIGSKRQKKILKSAEPMAGEYTAQSRVEKLPREDFKAAMVDLQDKMKTQSRIDILNQQFKKSDIPIRPRYYHNPLQYFDHVLLSDAYVNSFGGTVIDTYSDFIMPKTLKPVLKLHNPEKAGDKEAQQKLIKDNQEIITTLEAVDNWFSDVARFAQDPYMEIPLQDKWKAMITNILTFGRDTFVLENWKHLDPVTVNGTEYKGIPNTIKLMHPIEMGMVELDEYTWKLGGMYVHNDRSYIPKNQLVYLVNQFQSPMIGSLMYGYSKLQRALDPIRLLRRIFAQNYQQFIRNSYSGCGAFIFDSTQYPDGVRTKIRTAIKNSYVAGEIAIIDYANINDFKFEQFNIDVKISELQQLHESLIKVTIGVTGIPQSLIFDEAAATRATLVGRIVSFLNNQIETVRSMIARQIAAQWYMRVFRECYGKDEQLLETFYIDVEFEEMELETKLEKVGRLIQEQQLNPYTNEYLGEELGDKDYLEHIDEDKIEERKQQGPGGAPFGNRGPFGQKNFSVTDSSTGQNVSVSKEAV